MNPKVYQQQLHELGIERIEIDVSTIERARQSLNELEKYEDILKKIRHNIRIDIRSIRKEYLLLLKELNTSTEEKRRISAKEVQKRIKKKKFILKKRDSKIKSYEIIENTVDNYLNHIDTAKIYIQNSIETRVG
ncbi:MAG: hypothetical protein PWQ15_1305 [Methanobacterium sp.]|jgi:hypothetical protein|uniref:hypothetical protein n=1 Tax=Methanobacterium sp. TaxID=2164 RepID=UPI0003C94F8A|nr:hypothetical protein [Methanobacterium sp.]MDI3550202.1 hypothetical protein [Methanobacterium sp.]CDG64403.1 hypothetical protein MBMB1_0292 [Methanobacterium sp. MB1]